MNPWSLSIIYGLQVLLFFKLFSQTLTTSINLKHCFIQLFAISDWDWQQSLQTSNKRGRVESCLCVCLPHQDTSWLQNKQGWIFIHEIHWPGGCRRTDKATVSHQHHERSEKDTSEQEVETIFLIYNKYISAILS